MSTFVFVHGAWHGSWCWDRVVPELTAHGHDSIAVDLPCDDLDASLDDYANVVADACTSVDGPIVVVGHSLGCLTIPLVPAKRAVEHMIFVCGPIPAPGVPYVEFAASEGFLVPDIPFATMREDQSSLWENCDDAATAMYHDCSEADSRWAYERLRVQGSLPAVEPHPLREWPTVPSSYILATGDRLLDPAWSRKAALERLGSPAVELPGSHSPFLSQPARFAQALVDLTSGR